MHKLEANIESLILGALNFKQIPRLIGVSPQLTSICHAENAK